MKKYIDYNSLEQEAYEMLCHARQQVDLIIANTIKSMIDKQPDVLVRCKDCKYGEQCVPPCEDRYCVLYDQRHHGDWYY